MNRGKMEPSDINTRICKTFQDNEWKVFPAQDLKKGMRFRMFEPDGKFLVEGTAEYDANVDDQGIIGVVLADDWKGEKDIELDGNHI